MVEVISQSLKSVSVCHKWVHNDTKCMDGLVEDIYVDLYLKYVLNSLLSLPLQTAADCVDVCNAKIYTLTWCMWILRQLWSSGVFREWCINIRL